MDGFIHTFELTRRLSNEEFEKLRQAYPELFYNGETGEYVLGCYAERGIRIQIKRRKKDAVRYDKKHRGMEASIIVTLYKLLHTGEKLGVCGKDDIPECCARLSGLFAEATERTNIDLLAGAEIKRVDIACDIVTPSDEYSREIVRVAKLSRMPYGYKIWEPPKDGCGKKGWNADNAVFFYNHNQEAKGKIYNKKEDAETADSLDAYLKGIGKEDCGLIRCEITLKGNCLKKNKFITKSQINIPGIALLLRRLTEESQNLLEEFAGDFMLEHDMLSKNILIKYISRKYAGKQKRLQKMQEYIEEVNRNGWNNPDQFLSDVQTENIMKHFDSLGVSPVYTKKDFPYIPSLAKMMDHEYDTELLNYARHYNEKRGHEFIYWDAVKEAE